MTDNNAQSNHQDYKTGNTSEVPGPSYAGLKTAVFALAGFLFLGLVFIIAMIVYQARNIGETSPAAATSATSAPASDKSTPVGDFGSKQLGAPAGADLVGTSVGPDVLVLHYRRADGSEVLQLVSLRTGDLLGTIELAETP